jgi:hypothetical protein
MEVKIYGLSYNIGNDSPLHLSFDSLDCAGRLVVESVSGQRQEYQPELMTPLSVTVPDNSELGLSEIGLRILKWTRGGKGFGSSANEVWTFAKMGIHGFKFDRD